MKTEVAMYFSQSLHEALLRLKRTEGKTIENSVRFFLEVMQVLVVRHPWLRSHLEPLEPQSLMKNHHKIELSNDLYDFYFHWAGELGLKPSVLIRMVLEQTVRAYEKLAPKDRLITKEVFIELLQQTLAPVRVH